MYSSMIAQKIHAIYTYTDEHSVPLYQVVRYIPKEFRQRRWFTTSWPPQYIWGLTEGWYCQGYDRSYYKCRNHTITHKNCVYFEAQTHIVPYRLPQILASELILFVEGEKDVNSLEHIGFTASTNSGGVTNLQPQSLPYFVNKHLVIIADNDPIGHREALHHAQMFQQVTPHIKVILTLPYLQLHEDITDWIAYEQTDCHNKLYKIIKNTPVFTHNIKSHAVSTSSFQCQKYQKYSLNDILSKFEKCIKTGHNHWQAQCPAHDDMTQSLSITYTHNKLLLNCHAGCSTNTILSLCQLAWHDLFFS